MTARRPRRASAQRRREILSAALECFAAKGYSATTLEDIRARAGASTGSIYHHFVNKAQLAAELYLEGVRSTQESGLQALTAQEDLREGIQALVIAYLDWVQANPALARFLFAMRHADFMEPAEAELERMNRDTFAAAGAWFEARVASGEMPDIPIDVQRAILFGPASHFARRMLSGAARAEINRAKQQLAAASYAGLRALLPPVPAPRPKSQRG
jgi:AcrR family transcriptional regulator